jgi:UDP-N-acetylmuramoyl-L-alanyl-D-glutamate--2,6-diaminopimelate ligase
MRLNTLLQDLLIKQTTGSLEIDIHDIQVDSRRIQQGDLFIALSGHTVDGHDYISQAITNGASAVVVEKTVEVPSTVTTILVSDTQKAMAILSNRFFDFPSKKLNMIGITGTNGKTTTSTLIESILTRTGYSTGVIGTIHTKFADVVEEASHTTPISLDLQRTLKRMVDAKVTHVAMEVSSHALVQGRVRGIDFSSAVFSNLTQDHLDYHGTMDEYKQAKGLLFSQLGNGYGNQKKYAILNNDDEASKLYKTITSAEVITYGIDTPSDFQATNVSLTPKGTSFTLCTPFGTFETNMKLIGKFNVYNALSAIVTCFTQGIELKDILSALEEMPGVEGRFESVYAGQSFTAIVDFAHTPDSLENVLTTIQQFSKGHVFTLVGCGGNRDKGKRPIMASIAEKYSDFVVLTSDNPRFEDPSEILNDMEKGMSSSNYKTFVDRKEAISYVVKEAKEGDTILIAGKGHETYQIIGDTKHHFSDKEEVLQAILEKTSV